MKKEKKCNNTDENPFCLDTAMRRNCQNWNSYILSKLFFCHFSFFSFTWKFWLILPVKMAIHERRKNFFKLQTLELYICMTTTTHSFEMLKKGKKFTTLHSWFMKNSKHQKEVVFKSIQTNGLSMKDPVLFPKKSEDLPNSESSTRGWKWPHNTNWILY